MNPKAVDALQKQKKKKKYFRGGDTKNEKAGD